MPFPLRLPLVLLVGVIVVITGFWAALGRPVPMPPSPLAAGEKLPCVSYAPFRDGQSPLPGAVPIPESQIDEDLAQLAKITACVRTYSVQLGLDKVAPLAQKHGLKVLQGIWLNNQPANNKQEVDAGVAIAQKYPDTVSALVVGNESLLRGELSAPDISAILRDVKSRVGSTPVTYADVWEFWERAKALANDVDFVTVHILPYWEDLPVSAAEAGPHIDRIRQHVADVFPGKEILIGETGWPSAGRMREGALPSPADQALVLHDILRLAKEKGYRVNVIEAYDQPWKRRNEGTVGGHWGLIDASTRTEKFHWGEPVSNHPAWRSNALGGSALALAIFATAAFTAWAAGRVPGRRDWCAIAAVALVSGALFGAALGALPLESLGWIGWARNGAFFALSVAAGPLVGAAIVLGVPVPAFAVALDGARRRTASGFAVVVSLLLALAVVAVGEVAFELIFDPRYKDFPVYVLTPVVVAIGLLAVLHRPDGTGAGLAEKAAFWTLLVAGIYIPLNETLRNWQALWFGLLCLGLAVTLWRVRAARTTE